MGHTSAYRGVRPAQFGHAWPLWPACLRSSANPCRLGPGGGVTRLVVWVVGLGFATACGGQSTVRRASPGEEPGPGPGAGGSGAQSSTGGRAGRTGMSAGGRSNATGGNSSSGRGGTSPAGAGAGAVGASGGDAGAGFGAEGGEAGHGGVGESGSGGVGGTSNGGVAGVGGETGPQRVPPGVCPNPVAYSPGVERCGDESFIHRAEALGCALPERDPDDGPPQGDPHSCNQDNDCGDNGYCVHAHGEAGDPQFCITACQSDADCDAGHACVCHQYEHTLSGAVISIGRCLPARCLSDADCAAGAFCSSPLQSDGCNWDPPLPTELACQRDIDECSGPDECPWPGVGEVPACIWGEGSARVCWFEQGC